MTTQSDITLEADNGIQMMGRAGVALGGAALATGLLFLGMTELLREPAIPHFAGVDIRPIHVELPPAVPPPPEIRVKPAKPETAPPPKRPIIETPGPSTTDRPAGPVKHIGIPGDGVALGEPGGFGVNTAPAADGGLLPLIRVEPLYPASAAARNIEGHVVLRFNIGASGLVDRDSIEVVSADPPGYFEHAAVKAVANWKYRAQTRNGQPVTTENVRASLSFKMPK